MSTIGNAVFDDASDDENDPDFVPEKHSESENEGSNAEAAALTPEDDTNKEAEREMQNRARASLWESFQTSVASTSANTLVAPTQPPKLVKVEKKYRFAGEIVTEIIEVPEDSNDAKKWPLWKPPTSTSQVETLKVADACLSAQPSLKSIPTPPAEMSTWSVPEIASEASESLNAPRPLSATPSAHSASPTPSASGRPRPGPRKPKTVIAALPSQNKPKKLTTLDKSAMDWRAHVAAAEAETVGIGGLADELERNRRGGGYLEKVAFLDRVGERREELFEEGRKRRRKG